MKKLLIACSMVSACALVACAEAVLTPQAWFDVTTSLTNGGTLVVTGDALCEVTDSKFEIDSDLENPVTFTAASTFAQSVAKVSFNLDAAVVPFGALQTFDDQQTPPKVAFALYQSAENGSTTNFTAWVGNGWINLSGCSQIPDEGNAYALIMEFDNQTTDSNKVRFSIGQGATTNVLNGTGADAENWFSYSSRVTGEVAVNFVGCGKVASFLGQQFVVGGEIVVIGGKGDVVVNAEAKTAFEKTITSGTVGAFLAQDATTAFENSHFQSGLKVGEAYALGLLVVGTDGVTPRDEGKLKVVADAQASTTGGIPVKLNIVPPTDSGATITYQVKGSADGTDYVNVGDPVTDKDQIKIPTDYVDATGTYKYRFFKVITNVKLQDAPDPNAQQD